MVSKGTIDMLWARLKRLPIGQQLLLVWACAAILSLVGLGSLPLRDWDEGIVARVALETSLRPWPDNLMPTYWWELYRNKPPGIHLLIAACISLWRQLTQAPAVALPPEWVLRIGPAMVSTTLVPLIGWIQWRLRPGDRAATLASAAIALTLLPLARHGRLVMLDGCQLVAMAAVWLSLLEARGRGWPLISWGLGTGLAGSALLLLKAPAAAPILLGALVLRALDRDLNRQQWILLGSGVLLGLLPGLGWHLAHWLLRGPDALHMWIDQGYYRLHQALEGHRDGPIEVIIEVLEGGGPWLLLWPFGIAMAWRQRQLRWGRWSLGQTLLTAAMVLPLQTQLPWYSLLLWPAFCLICGPVLAALVNQPQGLALGGRLMARRLALVWQGLGGVLLLLGLLMALGSLNADRRYVPLAFVLAVALWLGSSWLQASSRSRRLEGAITLVAGCWFSLLLLMASPLWLWELQESWSTPAMAHVIRHQPSHQELALASQEGERPSLNWYVGRRIRASNKALRRAWNRGETVHLISRQAPTDSGLSCQSLGASGPAKLYRCARIGSAAG